MRILQVNTVAGIGSTGRIACDIAELVNSGGGDCRIAYGIEPCPEKYKDIAFRIGSDFSVKLHSAVSQLFDAEGLGSQSASRQLIEYIEKYKPDILHLHNIHGCFLNYPILFDYLKKSQLPIVWTLHDCWAFSLDRENCGIDQRWWESALQESRAIAVPGSFNDQFADADIRNYVGNVWYQREVFIPKGWPRRLIGVCCNIFCSISGVITDFRASVNIAPGAMPFTRIFFSPRSNAIFLTR